MNEFRSILALSLILGLSTVACAADDDFDDDEEQVEELGSTESEQIIVRCRPRPGKQCPQQDPKKSTGTRPPPPKPKPKTPNASQRQTQTKN